ncbi:MAG: Kynurenine formamidase [Planctomycetes bacterium]|nr:Kynurenine formamidase [Planctomycetota bacterium]
MTPRFVLPACAVLAGLAACRGPIEIVREVPIVGEVVADPPFPEGWRVVDLTRPLDASAPRAQHSRQFPFERMDLPADRPGGVHTGAVTLMEHMGTHVSAPKSRVPGGDAMEMWRATDHLLPLAVVDAPAGTDIASADAILAHEREHGAIPRGSAVVLRTRPGSPRAAGWSGEAARMLVRERGAKLVGADGPQIDPAAAAADGPAQTAVAEAGAWQLAGLGSLSNLPSRGAWLVTAPLPVTGGTGAPARAIALVPPHKVRK